MIIKSLLFVPAKEKMIGKIGTFNTDAYIIDLEDSVEECNKESALNAVLLFLKSLDYNTAKIFIRLNKDKYIREAKALSNFSRIGFMLPKFEKIEEYSECMDIWEKHEIIALIETPKGITFLEHIAACPWVNALAFGAEDYTAKVNMKNNLQCLLFQKSMLVTYAKAFDKKVYDTPSFQLNDKEAFESEVKEAVDLGFDGKLAINPKHVGYINECFFQNDLEMIQKIVNEYERQQEAVLVYNGKVYEKMHIARFKRILKECTEV